jgi:hypothetical protein
MLLGEVSLCAACQVNQQVSHVRYMRFRVPAALELDLVPGKCKDIEYDVLTW